MIKRKLFILVHIGQHVSQFFEFFEANIAVVSYGCVLLFRQVNSVLYSSFFCLLLFFALSVGDFAQIRRLIPTYQC